MKEKLSRIFFSSQIQYFLIYGFAASPLTFICLDAFSPEQTGCNKDNIIHDIQYNILLEHKVDF